MQKHNTKGLNISTACTEYTNFSGWKTMPNVTVSISEELKEKMDQLPELNWSEITREFLVEKVKRALLLKQIDKMLGNSKLTEKNALELGEKIKKSMWKRYRAEGW